MRGWVEMSVAAIWAAAGIGCGSDGPRTVYDPDPNRKIPAIIHATSAHDASVIPELVKNLDSDDPAIRFYANRGLCHLTGQDFDYRYYEGEAQRQAAIDRWRRWLSSNGASTAPPVK